MLEAVRQVAKKAAPGLLICRRSDKWPPGQRRILLLQVLVSSFPRKTKTYLLPQLRNPVEIRECNTSSKTLDQNEFHGARDSIVLRGVSLTNSSTPWRKSWEQGMRKRGKRRGSWLAEICTIISLPETLGCRPWWFRRPSARCEKHKQEKKKRRRHMCITHRTKYTMRTSYSIYWVNRQGSVSPVQSHFPHYPIRGKSPKRRRQSSVESFNQLEGCFQTL